MKGNIQGKERERNSPKQPGWVLSLFSLSTLSICRCIALLSSTTLQHINTISDIGIADWGLHCCNACPAQSVDGVLFILVFLTPFTFLKLQCRCVEDLIHQCFDIIHIDSALWSQLEVNFGNSFYSDINPQIIRERNNMLKRGCYQVSRGQLQLEEWLPMRQEPKRW